MLLELLSICVLCLEHENELSEGFPVSVCTFRKKEKRKKEKRKKILEIVLKIQTGRVSLGGFCLDF